MIYLGLTSIEAEHKLKQFGPNSVPIKKSIGFLTLMWRSIREPILLFLISAGVISFFLSELSDAVFLMTTVVIISAISIFQVRKSERAISSLSDLSAPAAVVIRDGEEKLVPSESLVPGDLILLHEGQRVLADAVVVEATHLSIDESMLTGESISKHKSANDAVYSGTLVVKGHARAKVVETGANTKLGQIGASLVDIQIERTNLQRELDVIVRYIALAAGVAAALVFLLYGLLRANWLEAALAGIAAAMALIPEEFPIVLTVFLALGAWRLSQVNVITRQAPVIELLGTITVLCVDKTGTLTTNQMTLQHTEPEVGYFGRLACPPNPTDPMDRAFSESFKPESGLKLIQEYPISDEVLAVAQVWQSESDEYLVAAKGAPEHIARLCGFDDSQIRTLMSEVEAKAEQGFRLLGVAKASFPISIALPTEIAAFDFAFLGIANLRDPIRPNLTSALTELRSAGVRTIMLTGDYAGTASAIAKEIGLSNPDTVITGAELDSLDDEQLAQVMKSTNIFARVVPSQKLRLVRALRTDGEIVGMTGDGVNDAPALGIADVGIAMGMRGTDVAREAADLVLTDDDFSSIVAGIKQGRRIYNNLRKAMIYIATIHIPIFGMALLPVFTSYWPLVLLPAQIALLEMVIDPAASVVFEGEKAERDVMRKRPRRINERVFNKEAIVRSIFQGAVLLIAVWAVYFGALVLGMQDEVVRSLAFATVMIGNVFLVLSNRSNTLSIFAKQSWKDNPSVKWLVIGVIIAIILIFNLPILREVFNLSQLSLNQFIIVFLMASLSVVWFEFKKLKYARDATLTSTETPQT